jgi:transcriptional regulator with XRE-family HTH domain
MEFNLKKFANVIDTLIRGTSRERIAIECGCSVDALYKWKRGGSIPKTEVLMNITHLYNEFKKADLKVEDFFKIRNKE